ncbi:MAG: YfhO family protein [Clostridia bacterium]|nr:YfhO family protein [Clostridia bacterium]
METESVKKENFKTKASAFFDRNYALFFAPIIALVAYTVALFTYNIYPFGNEYTLASYDLSAQICPFIEHLFDVMDRKSTLSYSYAIAGGADVTGTFLYFFISPFSFVFLLFGQGMVAHASSIVIGLKIAAISVAGVWFSKTLFKEIPDYVCIAVGLVYAYCGYTFVSCTYINWMDFLIYLPFCVGAFVRFVKKGTFWIFSILVAVCIYTCFSIACFSMFIAFPTLVFYGLLCVKKEERNVFLTKLCLAFFAAVLMALPVLLPALSAYMRSGRESGFFDEFWYGFTVIDGEIQPLFNGEIFAERFGEAMYRKWSYILSDSAFLLLTLVWFVRKGLKDPFAKFMLVAGVFTLTPVLVDEAMLLMNFGSYMSYALRFGFLNAVYFLGGACLALEGLQYCNDVAFDGSPLVLKKKPLLPTLTENDGGRCAKKGSKFPAWFHTWTVVFLAVCAVCAAFLLWYISAGNYKELWTGLFKDDSEMLEALRDVSSKYAHSLGGAEVVAVLLGVVAVASFTGFALVAKRKVGVQLVSYALIVIVGLQALFYNNQMVLGNRSTQHIGLASYREICETLGEQDDSYFRIKDYSDDLTANAPFTGGGNAFGVFSSVIDKDNFVIYELFGYAGNGKNSLKSAHSDGRARGEEFGDSFLGYKYFIVPKDEKSELDEQAHLKPYVKSGESKQLEVGGYLVYENTLAFPLGFKVSGAFSFVEPNEGNSAYRKANQRALYNFLLGETVGVASAEITRTETEKLSTRLWEKAANVQVGAGRITATVSAEEGECLMLPFVASSGYRVRVNGKETTLVANDLKFLCVRLEAGENTVSFEYSTPYLADAGIGIGVALVGLFVLAFILKKTKLFTRCVPIVAWAGIALAVAVVAFFMLFPTVVWVVKLIKLLL